MKTRNKILALPLLRLSGLLLAVSSPFSTAAESADTFDTRPVTANTLAQSNPGTVVKSYEDGSSKMHEAVAKHHEDMAKGLQARIQEQKQLLEQYKSKSYIYGRWAQDLQGQADALIRKYEAAALRNLKQAALHRQLALKLKEGSGKAS